MIIWNLRVALPGMWDWRVFTLITLGAPGFDGNECPAFCPTKCDDSNEMYCYAGRDMNDCEKPGTCMPSKGGMF